MALLLAVLAGWCGKTKGHSLTRKEHKSTAMLSSFRLKTVRFCDTGHWQKNETGRPETFTSKIPAWGWGRSGGSRLRGRRSRRRWRRISLRRHRRRLFCDEDDDDNDNNHNDNRKTNNQENLFLKRKENKKNWNQKMKIKKTELKRKKTELMQTEIGVERVQARTWRLGPQLRGALN